jgi:hypothetical protein
LETARTDYRIWDEYNAELLKRRFTNSQFADDYARGPGIWSVPLERPPLRERIDDYRGDIKRDLRRLQSLLERLELIEEAPRVIARAIADEPSSKAAEGVKSIFIVHGRDEAAELSVHAFLREITTVESVVLHLEPNRGLTVIEKFEAVGSRAGFAVVLLTGDDVGRLAAEPSTRIRHALDSTWCGSSVSSWGRWADHTSSCCTKLASNSHPT